MKVKQVIFIVWLSYLKRNYSTNISKITSKSEKLNEVICFLNLIINTKT